MAAAARQPVTRISGPEGRFSCPGSFSSDLTQINCSYTQSQRLEQFLTTGVTDSAMTLSILGSLFTQYVTHTPSEWPRDPEHYGYRLGTSYAGGLGRASAEWLVGTVLRDDPRHIKCSEDPLLYGSTPNPDKPFSCSGRQRFFHALLDTVTVRGSSKGSAIRLTPNGPLIIDENAYRKGYKRKPAFDRLAGIFASAYTAYPWQPRSANTFGAIAQRAGLSFGTTFLGSFYTEYGGSILSKGKSR